MSERIAAVVLTVNGIGGFEVLVYPDGAIEVLTQFTDGVFRNLGRVSPEEWERFIERVQKARKHQQQEGGAGGE